jgi:hypothetical protein
MSIVLYVIGVIAVILGTAAVAFGVPDSDFSFGNTLIIAGTTAAVGGLIVIGLGAVVARLQQVADGLAAQLPIVPSRPMESFEAPSLRPQRAPFPPKPKAEEARETSAPDLPMEAEPIPAPTLQNPDVPSVVVEEATLSPPIPAGSELDVGELGGVAERPAQRADEKLRQEPMLNTGWRPTARQPSAYFDAVWPAETKPAKSTATPQTPPLEPQAETPVHGEPAVEAEVVPDVKPQGVAVLKSGVVDGMGYTLYVDGSIEAELPQGTLRFASIKELRSHLEQNS